MKSKSVYILSVQAKDLYIANNLISDNGTGYSTYDKKHRKKKVNKYIASLDYSLDQIQLRKLCEEKNIKFSFYAKKNDTCKSKEYSDMVINVDFNLTVREYNQFGKKQYIKFGYVAYENPCFTDCVWIENNELIGIKLKKVVENPVDADVLGKYFFYDTESKCYKRTKTNIKQIINTVDMRVDLYCNGFYCNGKKYVRWGRSAGAARVGKCLFIDERLYADMHKYDLCGLTINESDNIDLAAIESYLSLTGSSCIDILNIEKENILVIPDYDSPFTERVIAVRTKDKKLTANVEDAKIKNSIWDGQSLIDPSLMGEYHDKGFILLRNQFFKSACFNTNLQEWFKDNGITSVSQLNGDTLAKNIEDIKLITTESSIKYTKFDSLENWFNNISSIFGVIKHEKPPKYFGGRYTRINYQMLNSLQFDMEKLETFLQPTIEYLEALRDSPNVLKQHVNFSDSDNGQHRSIKTKNDLVFEFLKVNRDFHKTDVYDKFMRSVVISEFKEAKNGHIPISGTNAVVCGNPIEMLLRAIGKFDEKSQMGIGNIYTTRFNFNTKLFAGRSPFISMGNVWMPTNKDNADIKRYMNARPEIVYINSIGENTLQRNNGMDFDADTVILTDNEHIIELAEMNYTKYLTPTCLIESKKKLYKYTAMALSDLDAATKNNFIGRIVNLSQRLNSLLWDLLSIDPNYDYIEIYKDISKLAVLSGIAIDSAKKSYDINIASELKTIETKYTNFFRGYNGKQIKPKFFRNITKRNGYKLNTGKIDYIAHHTTMDLLQDILRPIRYRFFGKSKKLEIKDIINKDGYCKVEENRTQIGRIVKRIDKTKIAIGIIWRDKNMSLEARRNVIDDMRNNLQDWCNSRKLNNSTCIGLLQRIDDKELEKQDLGLYFQTILNIDSVDMFNYFKTKI